MQPAGLSATRLTALTNAMQGYVERGVYDAIDD
jgi:hypothetical protein